MDDYARFQENLIRLQDEEFPKRYQQAKFLIREPFQDDGKNKFANKPNLDLLITLSPNPKRISARRLSNAIGWNLLQIKSVLRWGIRQGYIEQLSDNLFKQEDNYEFGWPEYEELVEKEEETEPKE